MSPRVRIALLVAAKDLRIERRSRVVTNQVPTVNEVRLRFSGRGKPSPVTIGLHDIRYVDGAFRATNEMVARVNTLTFQRSTNAPRMAVTVGSVAAAGFTYFVGSQAHPRSVFVIDWALLLFLLSGMRYLLRYGGDDEKWAKSARVWIGTEDGLAKYPYIYSSAVSITPRAPPSIGSPRVSMRIRMAPTGLPSAPSSRLPWRSPMAGWSRRSS